jgi:2-polyprenyl-3-methyl-5-hydroxy-6-metoxy-1,4-benzoquinol methylase
MQMAPMGPAFFLGNYRPRTGMTQDLQANAMTLATQHQLEIDDKSRFGFGANWKRFLSLLDEQRVAAGMASLQHFLGVADLKGKSFLDIGSGSGLFSLAARRLGARVHSLDYDSDSVACTEGLRQQFYPNDPLWTTTAGSVLQADTLPAEKSFDVVYSWGVLHHTGNMWLAIENAAARVKDGGTLFISLYNDQGWRSHTWLRTKQAYNALPPALRFLVLWPATAVLWGPTVVRDTLSKGNPLHTWRNYASVMGRGMNAKHDVVDWVGGLPFEVATPERVVDFHRQRGFVLTHIRTCAGGIGCNEFVFVRR